MWLVELCLCMGGRAGDLKGLCPFHNEDTPSFHEDMVRNVFYCFGCQEGGDVFNLCKNPWDRIYSSSDRVGG